MDSDRFKMLRAVAEPVGFSILYPCQPLVLLGVRFDLVATNTYGSIWVYTLRPGVGEQLEINHDALVWLFKQGAVQVPYGAWR
jgi:hypothetical protein